MRNEGEIMERLQKVIASMGVCSRRKAEELITAGRIKVNKQLVTELGFKVSPQDTIYLDDEKLDREQKVYFVMNKPRGCISAVSDDMGRKVVVDYLKEQGVKERVFPVGRLDYDTSGVLMLTNDGELSNLLLHPKNQIDKVYLVRCQGIINSIAIRHLKNGVKLSDGTKTKPAKVAVVSKDKENNSSQVRVTIHEGRYHQVKLMFEAIGYPVKKLRREQFAFLTVEGLKPGEFRMLKVHEVKQLFVLGTHKPHLKSYKIRRM